MSNQTPIRQWTRFSSLHSASSSEPISGSSCARASSPQKVATPFIQSPESQKPNLVKPVTFSPSKLKFKPEKIDPSSKILVEEQKPKSFQGIQYHQKHVTTIAYEMKENNNVQTKHFDLDSVSSGIRAMKIVGENEGAYMQIIHSPKMGNSKINACDYKSSENPHPTSVVYANSNVQNVNNSLMFKASYNQHEPGVHLVL